MNQPERTSEPVKLAETGDVVHLALRSSLLNKTRCGVAFETDDTEQTNEPISCMGCLVYADIYEVPLETDEPIVNYFNEACWMKQVFRPSRSNITECCHTEDPCDYHKFVKP